MGKFLPKDEELISKLTQEYTENALADYSEMLGSSPTYLTYFNKKVTASSQDKNLDAVYQVLGSESPVKFNRIDNFPIYGLQQISLDLAEGTYGPESEVSTEAIILPSTIIPFVDDYISIQYVDSSSGLAEVKFVLFRITKVDKSVLGSTRFFKLQITMTAELLEQAEEQTEDEFEFNVTDYESNRQAILEKSDVRAIKLARSIRHFLAKEYLEMFNDSPVSSVSCPHDNGRLVCLMLNHFIEVSECFEFDRTYFDKLSVLYQPDISIYRLVKIEFSSFLLNIFLNPTYSAKIIKEGVEAIVSTEMIHEAFRTVYYITNSGCGTGSATTIFPSEGLLDAIKSNTLYTTSDKKIEDVLIYFVNEVGKDTFDKKKLVNDIKAALDSLDPILPNYRSFYLVPVLMFILKAIEDIYTLETRRYGG